MGYLHCKRIKRVSKDEFSSFLGYVVSVMPFYAHLSFAASHSTSSTSTFHTISQNGGNRPPFTFPLPFLFYDALEGSSWKGKIVVALVKLAVQREESRKKNEPTPRSLAVAFRRPSKREEGGTVLAWEGRRGRVPRKTRQQRWLERRKWCRSLKETELVKCGVECRGTYDDDKDEIVIPYTFSYSADLVKGENQPQKVKALFTVRDQKEGLISLIIHLLKAKVRRLYDIANVFSSMNLLKKEPYLTKGYKRILRENVAARGLRLQLSIVFLGESTHTNVYYNDLALGDA
ncbi:hypothetical protein LXL04_027252 [Taraxacum kok-saghyz]